MNKEKNLEELTEDLNVDTKELQCEELATEVDEQTITKVVAAVFEGIVRAIKRL